MVDDRRVDVSWLKRWSDGAAIGEEKTVELEWR
jgi:hypothetical protein